MTCLTAGACLSLTGRFAQFGQQAADGLRLWADDAGVDLTVVDDESDRAVLAEKLPIVAAHTELLFGPYSTVLMRAAIPIAAVAGRLLFNHGGSGGSLNQPGRVVNVLTPASRYAVPFVAYLAAAKHAPLFTSAGRGTFGRHVINGARDAAHTAGLTVEVLNPDSPPTGTWDLLSAGVYEDDVATVQSAQSMQNPPRFLCSVAAGVTQFAEDVPNPNGMFGIGQWAPDASPEKLNFTDRWRVRFGAAPDYPGVQAYAAGLIAEAAVRACGSVDAVPLWRALAAMDMRTVFGRFRLDPETGEQVGHEAVLTRWRDGRQVVL